MFIPNLISADSGGVVSLPSRIVIVEDEPDLREAVAEYLAVNGYEVTAVDSAAAMRALVESETFHLAILDIAMPGEDGLSLGRWLRGRMPIGIIYATAAGTTIDRIVGLELGADDYMVKPYELRELLARVRSVLRRIPGPSKPGPAGPAGEPVAGLIRPHVEPVRPVDHARVQGVRIEERLQVAVQEHVGVGQ